MSNAPAARVRATTSQPSQRMRRVGEQVRHAVVALLQRGEIDEPLLKGKIISVSEVRMSPDLKIATAFISAMGQVETETVVKALAKHRLGKTSVEGTCWSFGGAPLGNLFDPVLEADSEAALEAAWKAGIRFFDTAPLYGRGVSEERIGKFLKAKPRGEFAFATKVGRLLNKSGKAFIEPPFTNSADVEVVFDYSADGVKRSIDDSLKRIGLDSIDVVLIHDIGVDTHGPVEQPRRYREALEGAWPVLADLRRQGVIKAAGLGVNDWRVCVQFLKDADPDCFLLAGRYTLLEQEPLAELLPLCIKRGASVISAGPLNSGILATGAKPGARYNYLPAPPDIMRRVAAIEAVAKRHGVQLAAAALQFPLAHPAVATVLNGARSRAEIEANALLRREEIPAAFWADLKACKLLAADAPPPSGTPS